MMPVLAVCATATVVVTVAAGNPVRLVWVSGSLGCRTIAARSRDLILHTIPAFASIYRSNLLGFKGFHLFWGHFYQICGILVSCRDPDPSVCLRRETSPSGPGYPLPHLDVIELPMVCSREGG